MSLLSTLRFIVDHPLNRDRRLAALIGYARWQIGIRLLPGPVAVPFVKPTRLLVSAGMTGATQNVYCGLQEFEEMALVVHALRPGDLFVDVGANVGSYTVLAAGGAGANCVAFEPVPRTFRHLQTNIRLNGLESRVAARNIGIAATNGTLRFTSTLDTVNHVVASGERCDQSEAIPVESLDDALAASAAPSFLKIDVEGFETEVVRGAQATLRSRSLLAIIMELNGSGAKYGYDEGSLHASLCDLGFEPIRYDPFRRAVAAAAPENAWSGNRIYCRDRECLAERVCSAPGFSVHGRTV